jgi:hypothetical protein
MKKYYTRQRRKATSYELRTNKRRKATCIGHILHRNCLLKQIILGKIEVRRRRGRRCKQLLGSLKEKRWYCKLKQLENSLWKRLWTSLQTDYDMNETNDLTLLIECTKHIENRIVEGEMCFAAVTLLTSQNMLRILGRWKEDREYGNSCNDGQPQLGTERFQICSPIQVFVIWCPDEYIEPRQNTLNVLVIRSCWLPQNQLSKR